MDKRGTTIATLTMGMAGIQASVRVLLLMAKRGLVSPEEVEQEFTHLMFSFAAGKDHPEKEEHDQIFSVFEGQLAPLYATLREVAREHWRVDKSDG